MENTKRVRWIMNKGVVIYAISVLVNDISVGVDWTYNIKLIGSLIKVENTKKNIILKIGEIPL